MIKKMNKNVKKLDAWDMAWIKLAVVSGTLFLITIWPALMGWVTSVNAWWFLGAFVVFAARPFARFYGK